MIQDHSTNNGLHCLLACLCVSLVAVYAGSSLAVDATAKPTRQNDAASLIHISADNMKYDMKQGISSYTGNVRITHMGMELSGDTVTVTQQGDELEQIVVTGKPARYRQTTVEGESVLAESLSMTYSTNKNQLLLTENARLEQAGHIVESQRITYDTLQEVVIAGQTTSEDRVNITLTPKKPVPDQKTPAPANPTGK